MSRENEMVSGVYKKFSVVEIIRLKNLSYDLRFIRINYWTSIIKMWLF